MNDNSSRVIEVDINEILPNRFQPRIQFNEDEILELSDSIKEHGVIQPIVVRTIGDKYEIIAGERRYKASVLAGKETVPVIVKNLNDKDSAEIALIENIQRKNLTPIEEALSYKKILDMGYTTQENLANKLGKSQPSVANKIRLLNLSDEVQEALLQNKISERHARSLLKLSTSELQNKMLNKIITERLTVRRTDEEIEKLKSTNIEEEIQEINEKGDMYMNNNLMGTPSIPENPSAVPNFDIFGTSNSQFVKPNVEVPQEQSVAPSFDIFGGNIVSQPEVMAPTMEMPRVQEVPQIREVQPVQMTPQPEVMAPTIEMPRVQEVPQIREMQSVQVTPQPEVMAPTIEMPRVQEVPQTAPIIENIEPQLINQPVVENNFANDLFSFTPSNEPENVNLNIDNTVDNSVPEFKMPEPIIVTDYTKQYDPIMPQTQVVQQPIVDFKEVINAIRECSSKIEQYGFKIDVEEYDLASIYQVIFKIEK